MKKLMATLICLSMVMACLPGLSLVAFAADDIVLGDVTISADAEGYYIIDSEAKFIAVFGNGNTDIANTFGTSSSDLGPTYLLTKDITLDSTFKPAVAPFFGKLWGALDGEKNHKITIASVMANAATDYYAPSTIQYMGSLIHDVEYGEIKNLDVYGTASVATTGNGYYGVVAGQAKQSKIKNINNYVDVTGGQKNGTAGIVGSTNNASIESCANYGDIIANNQYSAGIAGDIYKTPVINCINEGVISGTKYSGGIVGNGKADAPAKVENSINKGAVTATAGRAGGIVGISKFKAADSIKGCKNYGAVSATEYAAGIVAEHSTNAFSFNGCENYGSVTSSGSRVAGIVGYLSASGTVTNCANLADITSSVVSMQIAGIIAVTSNGAITVNVENCYNKGNITVGTTWSTRGFASGIIGWLQAKDTLNVTNCYNLGQITGQYKATVAGQVQAGATLNITNFYDLTNTGMAFISYGQTAPTSATKAYTNADLAGIMSLIDDETWVSQNGYAYPSLKSNPHVSVLLGNGTTDAPYRIYTAGELKMISEYPAAIYKQFIDVVDMDEILCSETAFSGTYDGNGKSITLKIVDPVGKVDGEDVIASSSNLIYTSLFAQTNGATLKNITTKGSVTGNFHGANNYTCTTSLIGKASNTTLTNCKNYADVESIGYRVAGLIGLSGNSLTLTNCYNYGNVYGAGDASGIIAQFAYAGKMNNCGNYGDVTSLNNASGITRYAQSANILSGIFNVGTITATSAESGVATGLFADYNSGAKEIENSFNAGALIAKTTYGLAYSSATTGDGWLIENCYNAVYADYPIAATNKDALTVTNSYYLADEAAGEYGSNAAKSGLASIGLGGAFVVDSSSDYKYPQLTANKLDADYDNIEFYAVTVVDNAENGDVKLNAGKIGSFYLPYGTQLKVGVKVIDGDFYAGYVNGELAYEDVILEVVADKEIVVTDEVIAAVLPDVTPATYSFTTSEEAMIVDEVEYNKYALVASKAVKAAGLKLKEFGVLLSDSEDIALDKYGYLAKADNKKISSDGAYAVLLYSAQDDVNGMKDGVNYFVLPYAVYVDINGAEYKVQGTVDNFMFAE